MHGITLLRYSLYFLFLLIPFLAKAQTDVPFGARAAALGNASVTIPDLWSLHNNIAGIAGLTEIQAGAYAENRFGIRAFTTAALLGVYPTGKYGTYGISLSRFGDELYNRQHIGLGVAHKLGQFSLGVKADIWQVAVQGYGSRKAVSVAVGGQAEVVPGLYFGAHAYNLNQAKLSDFEDERLPTIMKAGISYMPYRKLLLLAETEKNIDHNATFKAGIEYQIFPDKFILRTGFQSLTNTLNFGAGFRARQFIVDYAFGSTTQLGNSHYLSVSYSFRSQAIVQSNATSPASINPM